MVTLLVIADSADVVCNVAPSVSTCSAMSLLLRVLVPSRNSVAVKVDKPRKSAGSARPPLMITICMVTMGTVVRGNKTTRRPLDNVASCALGRLTFKTSLFTGARPLISAPVSDWPLCAGAPLLWARVEEQQSAPIHSARKNLFFSMTGFLIFLGLL